MFCSSCGHDLGAGRYCPQCGHPAPPPPPPPSRPPTTPPTAHTVPPTVRYPLFADEADAPTTTWHPVPPAPTYPPPPPPPPANARRSRSPWVLLALALLLAAAGGAGWFLGAGDEPGRQVPVSSTEGATDAGRGSDLTARARVSVPDTAPPNLDVEGDPVSYVAAHLVDGVPETCWRMPGDGTGAVLTIHLPEQSAVRRVGLINGYAKSATSPAGDPVDWYHGNRRVLAVAWVFDDGTTVRQALEDTTGLQSITVDEVTTTIQLRLLSVSDPGTGPASRDFTAISDVSILGG